ncbi:MAG: polysaccharide biosynthesis C-terminal domain-containing protein [Bacteroidota bacterium]
MGEIKKQGIQNTLISYIGVAIGVVYTLVLQPIFLPPEELGLVRFITSVSILFGTVFPIGLGSFTIKYFPVFRDPARGHNGYLRLLLLTAFLSYLLFGVIVFLLEERIISFYDNAQLITDFFEYILPISFCVGFISMLNIYCISLFKSSFPSFLNDIFFRVGNILVISLYYFRLVDFDFFVLLYTLNFFMQLILLALYVLRIDGGIRYRINWQFLKKQDRKRMLLYLALIAPASIASMALRQIDVALLGSDINVANQLKDIAVYTIGFTIGSIIEIPYNALTRITDSKISDALHRQDIEMADRVYTRSTRILMGVGGLLLIGVVCNVKMLLTFLPDKYAESILVVMIISVSSFINMSTGINNSLVFYSEKYRYGSLLLIALIISSTALNLLLIPEYGIIGAAIATSTALLLYNLAKSYLIWRWYRMQPFGNYIYWVLLLIGTCLGVNLLLPELSTAWMDILYRSSVLSFIYIAGSYFSGVFPELNVLVKPSSLKD